MNIRKKNVLKHSKYVREMQDWYVSKGICCICKENEVYKDKRKCLICLMDKREEAVYQREKMKTETKYKNAQHRKRKLDLCIAFGVCRICQKRDILQGHTHCPICLAKKRNKHISDIEEKGIIPRYMRAELGVCYVCGKNPIVKNKRVCEECLIIKQESIKKCRELTDNTNHIWKKDDKVMYEYKRKMKERAEVNTYFST